MKRFLTISLLAASLVLAGLGEARAFDTSSRHLDLDAKLYPGSVCVRYAGAQPALNYSQMANPDPTYDLYVDCPVVKDGPRSAWISKASVRVLDNHVSKGVSCSVHSVGRMSDGSISGHASARRTSVGYGTAPQVLNFDNPVGSTFNPYYFSCVIPDSDISWSYLESISVTETLGGSGSY